MMDRAPRPEDGGLKFQDLQGKILPELHLIAAGLGIDNYRKLKKDALALAILERQAAGAGQQLARGYLEIGPDGYGFLQLDLLDQESRSVLVSAGLIKQYQLRTGDSVIGRARPPRENERYGTLMRVEAVNGLDPQAAAARPRFDDLTPTFPDHQLVLEDPTMDEGSALRVVERAWAPVSRRRQMIRNSRAVIASPGSVHLGSMTFCTRSGSVLSALVA